MGFQVEAVDRDAEAVAALGRGSRAFVTRVADLEGGPWPYYGCVFDGIVVSNYLFRPLLPQIMNALDVNGVLIYETFMVGNERFGKPSNPAFLLRQGELLDVVRPKLKVVAFEQGEVAAPRPAMIQRLCATRAPAPEPAGHRWPFLSPAIRRGIHPRNPQFVASTLARGRPQAGHWLHTAHAESCQEKIMVCRSRYFDDPTLSPAERDARRQVGSAARLLFPPDGVCPGQYRPAGDQPDRFAGPLLVLLAGCSAGASGWPCTPSVPSTAAAGWAPNGKSASCAEFMAGKAVK
jgi:hypothetical protein